MTAPPKDPLDIVEAKFIAAMAPGGTLPPPTFVEIAFAGRSNVGKSSLINTLVQRKGLVRTSSTPGCTRQVNLFEIGARDGTKCVLADLPGYGFAQRSKDERKQWAALIEGYLSTRAVLRVACVLVDARRGIEDDDRELFDFVRSARDRGVGQLEVIVAATKVDKVPRSAKKSTLDRICQSAGAPVVGCSAVTGEGRTELWKALRRAAGLAGSKPSKAGEAADVPTPDAVLDGTRNG
ncbi:MAG TPA: ribosome biogenesis GTP-binding protein YihA/YsxC [Polyangiaceae bacterium]|nr:ribosome biogenesis GTP-binding protein YihA/YsxC [Polyangiaceae bacterium]